MAAQQDLVSLMTRMGVPFDLVTHKTGHGPQGDQPGTCVVLAPEGDDRFINFHFDCDGSFELLETQ